MRRRSPLTATVRVKLQMNAFVRGQLLNTNEKPISKTDLQRDQAEQRVVVALLAGLRKRTISRTVPVLPGMLMNAQGTYRRRRHPDPRFRVDPLAHAPDKDIFKRRGPRYPPARAGEQAKTEAISAAAAVSQRRIREHAQERRSQQIIQDLIHRTWAGRGD